MATSGVGVADRLRVLLAGAWLGLLLCVAAVATPAGFAVLSQADAGRLASRILATEAYLSLALAMTLLVLERRSARARADEGVGSQFSGGMVLALLALFCTVLGWFVVQPQMAAARLGQGPLSFAQWHAVSAVFFGVKVLAVAALAWRGTAVAVSRLPTS